MKFIAVLQFECNCKYYTIHTKIDLRTLPLHGDNVVINDNFFTHTAAIHIADPHDGYTILNFKPVCFDEQGLKDFVDYLNENYDIAVPFNELCVSNQGDSALLPVSV